MGNHSWAADTRCIFHLPVLWTWTAAGWSHHLCRAMNTPVLFPSLQGRTHIFKIHARSMSVERDIRFELLARLCPNSTGKLNVFISLTSSVYVLCPLAVSAELSLSLPGAEIRSVCTEAGMFAIRARRKIATEKDFLEAVNKVIKSYAKFSATPRYMTYN